MDCRVKPGNDEPRGKMPFWQACQHLTHHIKGAIPREGDLFPRRGDVPGEYEVFAPKDALFAGVYVLNDRNRAVSGMAAQ
jgi:hypothetical protein